VLDIISEYCSGGSILELLNKFDKFDEKLIKRYTKQVLEGLNYLHQQGTAHFNLKASNVLVDSNGVIKISDYVEYHSLSGRNSKQMIDLATSSMKGK
jgi:serine/threonine protein kinase